MKRFLLTIITLLTLVACETETYEYSITYRVHYSETNVETFFDTYEGTHGYYIGSDRGTNFIKRESISGPDVIKTSAPIEIVSNTSKSLGVKEQMEDEWGFVLNDKGHVIPSLQKRSYGFNYDIRLSTFEIDGECHEYLVVRNYSENTGGVGIAHWEGCRYCNGIQADSLKTK